MSKYIGEKVITDDPISLAAHELTLWFPGPIYELAAGTLYIVFYVAFLAFYFGVALLIFSALYETYKFMSKATQDNKETTKTSS